MVSVPFDPLLLGSSLSKPHVTPSSEIQLPSLQLLMRTARGLGFKALRFRFGGNAAYVAISLEKISFVGGIIKAPKIIYS